MWSQGQLCLGLWVCGSAGLLLLLSGATRGGAGRVLPVMDALVTVTPGLQHSAGTMSTDLCLLEAVAIARWAPGAL